MKFANCVSLPARSKVLLMLLVGSILALGLGTTAMAQPAENDYAILIVGDEGNAEMLRLEKVLISEMGKEVRQLTAEERLPIFSYHFNKERERAYCESKLNVLGEDLLFVGIVKLNNKVPLKVVYRVDRIVSPARAAKDIMDRAEEILGEAGGEAPKPEASPSPSPGETSTQPAKPEARASGGGGFRVQLGSFAQLKYAQDRVSKASRSQLQAAIVEAKGSDGDTVYKVLSPLMTERATADALLKRFHEAGFEEAFLTKSGE